jgi:hypothetical protein
MFDNPSESLKDRRIKNAEKACANSISDWAKSYWFEVFRKLCKKYDRMEYFRKTIH